MIELRDVTKRYLEGEPGEYQALRGISLTLEAGNVSVLRGPSGSGKTTLLAIVGSMARPSTGRVFYHGREITSLPEKFLTELRRKNFGFIFQSFNLVRGMSAVENAMLPAVPLGEPRRAVYERAMGLFEQFGMLHKAHARVEHLSGGEAQRVAIVRALINSPEVIIADEPTAHLDTALSEETLRIFEGLNKSGRTLIIASHDPVVCNATFINRVVDIRDGRLA